MPSTQALSEVLRKREGRVIFTILFYIAVDFPGGLDGRESACNAGDLGAIPGLGRSPGEGKGYPLQYSGLESSMDYTVRGVAKSETRLNDFIIIIC